MKIFTIIVWWTAMVKAEIQTIDSYCNKYPNFFNKTYMGDNSNNIIEYFSDIGQNIVSKRYRFLIHDNLRLKRKSDDSSTTEKDNSNTTETATDLSTTTPKVPGWRHFVLGGNFSDIPEDISLVMNQDGTLAVNFTIIPATCVLGSIREKNRGMNICTMALITNKILLTSGGCTAGLSTMGGPEGFWVNCGINVEKTLDFTTRDVEVFYNYGHYYNLNMTRLRKNAMSLVQVNKPFEASQTEGYSTSKAGLGGWFPITFGGEYMIPQINYPPMPNFSTEKREWEMSHFYNTCYLYTRNVTDDDQSWEHVMLETDVLSNEDCRKRNVQIEGDEFCLLIASKRNGPCSLLLGGPVICGAGVLEGIISYDTYDRCNKPNRIFIATRVDMYMDYIYKLTNLPPINGTEAPSYLQEAKRPFLSIDENIVDLTVVAVTAIVTFLILLFAVIAFLVYLFRCKKLKPQDSTTKSYPSFTISINSVLPWLLVVSNIVIYLRLRESVEKESTKKERV